MRIGGRASRLRRFGRRAGLWLWEGRGVHSFSGRGGFVLLLNDWVLHYTGLRGLETSPDQLSNISRYIPLLMVKLVHTTTESREPGISWV